MTDAELAARLHRDLAQLATDAGWSTVATTGQALGHYTDAVADAKEALGLDDLADATPAQRKRVRQLALGACLERLERHYATLVDIDVGQRSERLSQIAGAIARLRAASATGGGAVAQGLTIRRGAAVDYTAGEGDADG